ncbi:MAG: hypothetical protein F6J93_35910 [Oscillatoria sp. SIO1A7]|nr:hypothetical protein [Oscillatoria sp. SIO1A7]
MPNAQCPIPKFTIQSCQECIAYDKSKMTKAKVVWTKQLGSAESDMSHGIATDSNGNVYITGSTKGDLGGPNQGENDAWVAKYDGEGNQQWVKQLGTDGNDMAWGIATDSSDNIYLTGYTTGSLEGSNAGGHDAWIAKYDSNGNKIWLEQLGTAGDDKSYGVATDGSGNIYISGGTTGSLEGSNKGDYDAWVAKYSSDGKQQWLKQLGSSQEDSSWGIATSESGDIYITGRTTGSLAGDAEGFDAWVAKYDSEGNQQWIQQLSSSGQDYSYGVAVDSSGNAYLTGRTTGSLEEEGRNAGAFDAWIAKYDSEGNKQWVKQVGGLKNDFAFAIALDSSSNAYISGCTQGDLAASNQGGWDAWVAKYDSKGNEEWIQQLGSSGQEFSWGVVVDDSGNIYATGHTTGTLEEGSSNAGSYDVWITKLSEE